MPFDRVKLPAPPSAATDVPVPVATFAAPISSSVVVPLTSLVKEKSPVTVKIDPTPSVRLPPIDLMFFWSALPFVPSVNVMVCPEDAIVSLTAPPVVLTATLIPPVSVISEGSPLMVILGAEVSSA